MVRNFRNYKNYYDPTFQALDNRFLIFCFGSLTLREIKNLVFNNNNVFRTITELVVKSSDP